MKKLVYTALILLAFATFVRAELLLSVYNAGLCIFEMTGHVRSESGGWDGIEGVLVEFSSAGLCPSGQTYTDVNGDFSIYVFTDGSVIFSFTAYEFEPVFKLINTDQPDVPILIDMDPSI